MQYQLFENEAGKNITVVGDDAQMYVATDRHPQWDRIVEGARAGDAAVTRLFDLNDTANSKFEALSDRVSVAGGKIYFDSEEVGGELAEQIIKFIQEDVDDWAPLVSFYEKVMTNLNTHTREQLYRWLSQQSFQIDAAGDIIAYKGVIRNEDSKDERFTYTSVSTGRAIVDGETFEGHIPNWIGAVVEMPRGEVTADPATGCSQGLHAGTWNYANGFARGATLMVKINPRDVVSVPTDCDSQKVRVCRYTVVDITDKENVSPLYSNASDDILAEEDPYNDYDDGYESPSGHF